MKNKNVLIIGGCGFIGSNLSSFLFQKGFSVYCFDMNIPEKVIDGVHYICGDFFDDYTLENALEGMDYVVHSLSTVNPGNSNAKYMQGYERDFIQTVKLCKMITDRRIRMIFLSSGGTVYGDKPIQPIVETDLPMPINHYGNVKLCIENVIRTFNIQAHTKMLIARISNPYGPGQDYSKGVGFIDAVLKKTIAKEPIEIWGDGKVVRDYIYIEDVCMLLETLFEYRGEQDTFNISSGIGTAQNDILEIIKQLGLHLQVEYKESRSVDVKKVILNNDRVMSLTNIELKKIEQGIQLYYEWIVTHKA